MTGKKIFSMPWELFMNYYMINYITVIRLIIVINFFFHIIYYHDIIDAT